MARPIMIQGTMSNVGKSVLTAGLCRVLLQDGYRVMPFKSQNMALNSFITANGLEMGRAQVMQAEAAGVEPEAAMNPILLKPTSDTGSQVILNGKPVGMMSAVEYYRKKKEYIPWILDAYHKLADRCDVVVIEGAGSPAEINLRQDDIVNMGLAELLDAPVLLTGDIDRGGVFAQILGTAELMERDERARIKGTVINKFRGDRSILKPGLDMLEGRTGIPVLGVIPYFHLDLDEEDSLSERFKRQRESFLVDVAVIRLPRISNFTDFAPLEAMEQIRVRYVSSAKEFGAPDAVILPGTKDTIGDLLWMRQNGLEAKILRHAEQGRTVFGICGGYQMLGTKIADPQGAEHSGETAGLGLLPVSTVFTQEKKRTRVQGRFRKLSGILSGLSGAEYEGYEIHMGRTTPEDGAHPLLDMKGQGCGVDGAQRGSVYGCYVHGIFDSAEAAEGFVAGLLSEKGLDPSKIQAADWKAHKEEQYEQLADIIRENLDMEAVYRIIEKGMEAPCSL